MMSIYSRTLLWIAFAAIVSFLFPGCDFSDDINDSENNISVADDALAQENHARTAKTDDYEKDIEEETDPGLIDPIQNVLDQVVPSGAAAQQGLLGQANSVPQMQAGSGDGTLGSALVDWSSFDASAQSASAGYGLGASGIGGGGAGMGGLGAGGFGPGGGGGGGAIRPASKSYNASLGSKGGSSRNPRVAGGLGGRGARFDNNFAGWGGLEENEFSSFTPNRFNNVLTSPFSTFGADVDTASYTILRYYVQNLHQSPDNQLLRTEEMLNYFVYDYPNPKDNEPFSMTTELVNTPWNKDTQLLLIGIQTPKLQPEKIPPSNIVFLIDVSGSMMSRDKLPLLQRTILESLPSFSEKDRISIVTYASEEKLVLSGANPIRDREKIEEAVYSLYPGGFTYGERGLEMAYEQASKYFIKGGNNRIILGTDGDLNVGISSANELKAYVEKKRKNGIFLSVMGFGWGNLKDNRMEALADFGNGSYHYIDSIQEGKRVLVDERESTLFTVAKDVKFQIDFNPSKVKGYRLIGYETRKLNTEDFKDDTKDGGEVGANQQVTALYEIVPAGSSVEVFQADSAYQKSEIIPSEDLATLAVRYKKPDGDKSKEIKIPVSSQVSSSMSENIQFAAAVAEVGMLLNHSEFKGTSSYSSAIKLLNTLRSVQIDPARSEFLEIVKKLRNIRFNSEQELGIKLSSHKVEGPLGEHLIHKIVEHR
ncbi:MAG: von Willebrand factor type A domain-containing protein, partial [Proteobacteria bacterium]|nr:von Willebrand factor type A domain-containing protein [Pseudomonadota bacterium]